MLLHLSIRGALTPWPLVPLLGPGLWRVVGVLPPPAVLGVKGPAELVDHVGVHGDLHHLGHEHVQLGDVALGHVTDQGERE